MKRTKINFWVDTLIFINFVGAIFTGVLLHRFPPELKENLIFGVNRYDWGDLHWMLCLSLILLCAIHLVLHWGWININFNKYLRVGPKTLIGFILMIVLLSGILAPMFLTSGFPNRKEFKDTYPKTLSGDVEVKVDVSGY
ncbi:MAG: DUF4405 domain-containing protein [Deltaproteobacteria bacterium]|uniref:DUF4405 domain-containing protein n=1 Tax=Candidatus Zymogenus saltonus TaxID=2844893 RepID=A0A9D8KGH2_9DELT|nr:DUF4405 domain-containing protein [Candidatus Zymogenus saltonus]